MLMVTVCAKENVNSVKQGADNWLVFDTSNTSKQDSVWHFELTHTGKYDIQILSEISGLGSDSSVAPNVSVLIDGEAINGVLQQRFRIKPENKELNVFQFEQVYNFNQAGEHSLTIKVDEAVKQVRLVPNYKNVLGTGEFHQQWLAMHE